MSRPAISPIRAPSKRCRKPRKAAAGPIDILVNNAGITRDNLFMRMKDDEWDQVIAVNLTAAFRLSRAVLRGMMKKRWGRIISITSVVGATGNPGQGNYAAAKAGLVGHDEIAGRRSRRAATSRSIALRRASSPPPMTDVLNEAQKSRLLARIPAGRYGHAGGNRGRRRLSGERGGGLRDRPNAPCQWRNGDDLTR